jgi:hypothetical protein
MRVLHEVLGGGEGLLRRGFLALELGRGEGLVLRKGGLHLVQLALQLLEEEDREKRKREAEDEALAKSLSTGEPAGKRRRTDEAAAEMTSDELIVRLLQEEEEETQRRERAKKAKEEEAMSRKLIEKLMRAEEMDHDEWVRSELAQIDERESKGATMTTKKKKKPWPGFGFGWGDKERMREKAEGKIVGDSDWKSTRFFADTSVLEGFLFSCAKQNGTRARVPFPCGPG